MWLIQPTEHVERKVRSGSKRKADEAWNENGGSSQPEFAPPAKGGPLEPPPPLDEDTDSLIDSVLAAGEASVLGASGRMASAVPSRAAVTYSYRMPVSSERTNGLFDKPDFNYRTPPSPMDPDLESFIDSMLAEGEGERLDPLDLDDEAAPSPLDPDIDLLIESLLAKEEKTLLGDSAVPLEDPLSPLDAGVDALIESVLSGKESELLEDAWSLLEEDMGWEDERSPAPVSMKLPVGAGNLGEDSDAALTMEIHSETASGSPHSEAGLSLGVDQLGSPKYVSFQGGEGLAVEDWLDAGRGEGAPQSVDLSSSTVTHPESPSRRGKPMKELRTKLRSLLRDRARARMDQESRSTSGAAHDPTSPSTTKGASSRRSPDVAPAETPASPEEGQTTRQSVVGSVASSSGAFSAPSPSSGPSAAAVSSEQSGTSVQMAFAPPPYTARNFLGWLDQVYPEVSDEVLVTHPFYRYPKDQMKLSMKEFDPKLASAMRSLSFAPHSVLGECRYLLKKKWLNLKDFEALMAHTERLCAYASGSMQVEIRRNRPMIAVETLGSIFLVLDTLYCLTEVLGSNAKKEVWWPWIVDRIKNVRFTPYIGSRVRRRSRELDIALSLSYALDYYRQGQRPPLRLVVGLKEAILCAPGTTKFKSSTWNFWRQDAMEWRAEQSLTAPSGEHSEHSELPSTSGSQ
ncbi:uncharacterized protein EMH_0020960 [Eimeria mitis]|uniref:Uncharacterized protein n=1 Tax=Eimeria mitis TaxID=44415 RepID=U6K949_9EIME|nr:uncharacterized protein EMH_0020960 [Eimeria mitis]CDJ34555.1 hypothetical protein, conserved [Eimeria mitis]